MAKKEEEVKKKEKRPSALKRDMQAEKRRLRNRVYKSRIKTAVRQFDESLEKGDQTSTKGALNDVYSLLDKCVQKGVIKLNKASRTKSRLTVRASKA